MQIFNQKLQPTLYRNRYRLVACDGSVADEVDPELLAKVLANPAKLLTPEIVQMTWQYSCKNSDNVIAETDAGGHQKARFIPVPAFQTAEAIDELCTRFLEAWEAKVGAGPSTGYVRI